MPYPSQLVDPMRKELTSLGVDELLTAEEVDQAMGEAPSQTMLVVINSVCGCAAANARPAVRLAMHAQDQPQRYVTVFAGQDLEATARMRSYLPGIPPSSPFIALMKSGQPVFVLERRNIEGRAANAIAYDLAEAYQTHCGNSAVASEPSESPLEEDPTTSETFRSIL
ncbi:MAG: BrxA/BrxB family bacilliredoxin [Rhodothermia bacterium]